MWKNALIYKRIFFVFNGLCIALVVYGVVGYFFFGHDYLRSQIYLLAAFISVFVAALSKRLQDKNVESPIGSQMKPRFKVPGWAYGNVIAYIIFMALRLFTDLLRSPKILYSCIVIFTLLSGKLAFDQYRFYSKYGFKLTYIHWLGVIVAMGVLVLFAYGALTS